MRAGHVFINGARLSEPYLRPAYRGDETGSWGRNPSGGYFVLGDNRAMSCDSRRAGGGAGALPLGRGHPGDCATGGDGLRQDRIVIGVLEADGTRRVITAGEAH